MHKHRFFQFLILCVLFCAPVCAQEFRQIRDGIEHAQFTREVKINEKETAPTVVNALRLDLKRARLDVVHAMDAAIGVEKTSSIAARHGAFAAVNAGFFRLDNSIFRGDAAGALYINNKLWSESYADRIALFISNKFDRTEISFAKPSLTYTIEIGGKTFFPNGINRERKPDELIIFTPEFHRTTLTDANGVKIVIQKNKIAQIFDRKGNAVIPTNGFVLSANGKMRNDVLRFVKIRRKVKHGTALRHTIKDEFPSDESRRTSAAFSTAEDIIGGVPQLIKDGKIEITWQQEKAAEKFVTDRHPRTAVAKLKDGRALLVTVDERQPGISAGMNLQELAETLLELGATDAMNLDGGGSTTMFLDGKVVNLPSDKEGERAVSDAILVTLRK